VIDRIRQDIQERLDELLAEADKLRRALIALDPRERSRTPDAEHANARPASIEPVAMPSSSPTTALPKPSSAGARTLAASAASTPARGATKAKVLGALSNDGALTAGEVAKATGLGRASVSTTLSKLAKSGEIAKAKRGYRLPVSADAPGLAQGSVTSQES
jgi:CRP-like cAMP-binding protein